MISFTVPLIPLGKGRPRTSVVGGHARIFTDARTATAEREFVALAAPYAPREPFQGPLAVRLAYLLPIPASKPDWWQEAAAARRICHVVRGDLDNFVKLTLDALTRSGRWWRDDSQIVVLNAEKFYGRLPGTRVEIEELPHVTTRAEWETSRSTVAALRRLHTAVENA